MITRKSTCTIIIIIIYTRADEADSRANSRLGINKNNFEDGIGCEQVIQCPL